MHPAHALPLLLLLSLPLLAWAGSEEPAGPPPTPRRPVVDEYHGTKVTDDYRWLENADDPAVRAWSDAENAYARSVLGSLPHVDAIRKRVAQVIAEGMVDWWGVTWRQGTLYALMNRPPREQPYLVAIPSLADPASARTVVDPNLLDPTGSTSIDFHIPSHGGALVAVSLSRGGSESGDVHVFDTATGKETGDVVPRVNGGTAGGSLAWNGDDTGFWYTRYPRGDERPPEDRSFFQQVWFHRLGTPTEQDRYEVGKEFPRIAEVQLDASPDGRHVLASVANGDGGEFAQWLRGPEGRWTQLTKFEDEVIRASLGQDGNLYLLSRAGAPRGKVLRVPLSAPALAKATVLVPESDAVIESLHPAARILYVVDMMGGPTRIRAVAPDGTTSVLATLPVSTVGAVVPLDGDDVLYDDQSYLEPRAWYRFDASQGTASRTGLACRCSVDFQDAEVIRDAAVSKDGTKIPFTILKRKADPLDGKRPTVLWGYGGYGVCESPWFGAKNRIWLDQGGVLVTANLRGGGEFGEAWHRAGSLARKQNVFDDFAACAARLEEMKVTNPSRLAIKGGSNGGLLMGAVLTQHPDLCKAVVSSVGIYDMLRVELHPNGAFNVTEFGTVKDADLFRAMYAYSPYHHVVDGTAYPAILMSTGWNDPRVDPYHSRKMVARLQAATSSKEPILLRTTSNAGHGADNLSQRVEQETDVLAFLCRELGVDFHP